MPLKEALVAYWGCPFPDHTAQDLEDMARSGVTTLVLWVTEFDTRFLPYAKIAPTLKKARDLGLKVLVDLWGFGNLFCHNARISEFAQEHPETWQVGSDGKPTPTCCINHPHLQEWLDHQIQEFHHRFQVDGYLWDEVHYDSRGWPQVWHCRCPTCQQHYQEQYGTPMPQTLTPQVAEFRKAAMVQFIRHLCQTVKALDPRLETHICLYPEDWTPSRFGTEDWEAIAQIPELDVLGTDPYWIGIADRLGVDESPYRLQEDETFEEHIGRFVNKVVRLAHTHNKRSAVWVQACCIPQGREHEVYQAVKIVEARGADIVGAWSYRDYGFLNPSHNPEEVWRHLTRGFREALAR
jgi:hypothetical protein